jgi:hypothetical protein
MGKGSQVFKSYQSIPPVCDTISQAAVFEARIAVSAVSSLPSPSPAQAKNPVWGFMPGDYARRERR